MAALNGRRAGVELERSILMSVHVGPDGQARGEGPEGRGEGLVRRATEGQLFGFNRYMMSWVLRAGTGRVEDGGG